MNEPFYDKLESFMLSGPVVAAVFTGKDVVQTCREMIGPTDPTKAPPGTIRHDFGKGLPNNAVHASDSVKSAQCEIDLWCGSPWYLSAVRMVESK